MLWQFRRELIAELLKEGEVVISMPFVGHEDDFKAMGCRCMDIKLDRRKIDPAAEIGLYKLYKEMIRREAPDLVITYSIKPNIYAGYACRKLHVPYCTNVQGLGTAFQKKSIAGVVTKMYRIALKEAKTVFFENTEIAREFMRRRIVSEDKIINLHGAGVNLEHFTEQPYPSEDDGVHFLFLGRIMKEKGVDEAIEAAKKIKAKYGDKVKFDLVGFFEDDYKETVEQLVADGLIEFHGFQEEPRPWYARAHCIVLPSYHEGMSNVLLEGAATGRALITSDIPGCREAVLEGKTGYLCKKEDVESLVQCNEKFLSLSPEERACMGSSGREWMKKHFDRAEIVKKAKEALLAAIPG